MAQATDAFDFKSAIAKAIAIFEEAANSKDAAAVGSLYTEDATLLPPGSPMIKGRQNIQQFWKSFFDAGASDGKLTTVELNAMGDVACEIGAFEANMPGAGKTQGKYVVIWKRQPDGNIRMAVDIFNTNT
jgi:uncharacterized protein (TIGR02246 family)